MPHAQTSLEEQAALDDLLIQKALSLDQTDIDFNRELEPGEKADDAIDFEDISDGDLAEDEDEKQGSSWPTDTSKTIGSSFDQDLNDFTQDGGLPGPTGNEGDGDGLDDLFGEDPSSPIHGGDGQMSNTQGGTNGATMSFDFEDDDLFGDPLGSLSETAPLSPTVKRNPEKPTEQPMSQPTVHTGPTVAPSREQLLQQQLFAMSRHDYANSDFPPAPPENQEELLASLWPKFERDTVPRFMNLLPPKKARYVGKTPLKVPKVLLPTKISLEVAPDQEKSFKVSTAGSKRTYDDIEGQGLVIIRDAAASQGSSDDEMDVDSEFENEPVGGVSWQDFQLACQDWDIPHLEESSSSEPETPLDVTAGEQEDLFQEIDEDWDRQMGRPSAKRRKLQKIENNILTAPRFVFPSFQDPEYATARIAKKVVLDLNDPQLLVDEDRSVVEHSMGKLGRLNAPRSGRAGFSKGLVQRYNISNDEAYDLLKENHQSKVRSTLGNIALSHSMPSLRLQWPYYKTKLAKQEARSFHRPTAYFKKDEPITFSKPRIVKRKHLKGKDTQTIFEKTKDLSMGDNSHVLLLEYSEEHPAMMSNFGMGSRIVNYYRRKNMEDTTRPKLDIGDTAVLLPQDKSPFSIFGHIDPGQITPAIYNGMFKAPIFKQDSKPTDFLMVRNTTGIGGSSWYLRNIEYLHTVGQQFPSVEIPGPHSRKVTTAAKNRLKMISYRRIKKNEPHRISVHEITRHFADTTDMQNRQKLKEFMVFSKEHKEWEMRPGEAVPEEDVIRSMVQPEDVCLLEAMQVGQQHLEDAGFSKGGDDSDDDEGKEGQSIEQQLAPWHTSKNFLNAASGKAMLQLHGEGDPTGRGEAISFLKTSMKGGFKAIGESVEDKLDAKRLKDLGGHSYNVARQQKAYEDSIRRIWETQKQSLSSTVEHSDGEMDQDGFDETDEPGNHGMTPRSEMPTPAAFRLRDDETTSQTSKFSRESQRGKVLKITRQVKDKYGNIETKTQIVTNPRVIHQYIKRRYAKEAEEFDIDNMAGDDDDEARRKEKMLRKELKRLERNKERRLARDKQKSGDVGGDGNPGSPNSSAANATKGGTGTQRKCANCGQVGHIKTNKKLCPLLNGTLKQADGFNDTAFNMGPAMGVPKPMSSPTV